VYDDDRHGEEQRRDGEFGDSGIMKMFNMALKMKTMTMIIIIRGIQSSHKGNWKLLLVIKSQLMILENEEMARVFTEVGSSL